MTSYRTAAKTPGVATARVLRDLGLVQGIDFRIRGAYRNGERFGTYASIITSYGHRIVARNADLIEDLVTHDGGWMMLVSVLYTVSGNPRTEVANFGEAIRHEKPVTVPQHDLTVAETAEPVKQAAPRPALKQTYRGQLFHQPHPAAQAAAATQRQDVHPYGTSPYEGLAQRPFGRLTWAREDAGHVWFHQVIRDSPRYELRKYSGPAAVNGWYLTGPNGSRKYMGTRLTQAAEAAESVILAL